MFKSIFFRHFTVMAAILVACFTLLGTVLLMMTASYSIEEKQDQLQSAAQKLSKLTADMEVSPLLLYAQEKSGSQSSKAFSNYRNIVDLYSENGTRDILIAEAADRAALWFTNTNEVRYERGVVPRDVIREIETTGIYKSTGTMDGLFTESRYTVGVPMIAEHKTSEGLAVTYVRGYLLISSPEESLTTLLSVVSQFFFVSVGVVFLISLIMIYTGTKSTTRPIREMRQALESYSRGDFSVRLTTKSGGELGELCHSFNEMADSLEQMENSRRGFMANISHDLKTPMTSISGFLDGILDGTIPSERERAYLERVSQEVQRLRRLVNSILDVTRLEGGQISLHVRELDIGELICRVLFSFERTIEEKGIRVIPPDPEGPIVAADEDSVVRILTNLIGNAVKFTPQGGEIRASVERLPRRMARICVVNTGSSIPEEDLPFLFERFYKADKSRNLDKEGTGLGLYIARMLVSLNGGEIGVRSLPGEGTEFFFTLELSREGMSLGGRKN